MSTKSAEDEETHLEMLAKVSGVDELARTICRHAIRSIPHGHFVIVIVENGDTNPDKSAVALRSNIVPNPGVTTGDILRKIADALDAGIELERPTRGQAS